MINGVHPVLSLMEEVNLNDTEEPSVTRHDDVPMVHGRQSSVIDLSGRCSEIVVHEMDSDSDAGSEDVELLPHRYVAGSDDCGGHLYVNRLSLATELYRTREPLPYDQDLKTGEPGCETDDEVRVKENGSSSASIDLEKNEHKSQCGKVLNGCTTQRDSDEEPLRLQAPGGSFCVREITPFLPNNVQQCPCTII